MTLDFNTEHWYGNWLAVIAAVILFTIFLLGFSMPRKKYEWRQVGIYEAFLIALFTEMFGFPLTIFLLTSYFGANLSYSSYGGHLLAVLMTSSGIISLDLAVDIVMTISLILILIGLLLAGFGWHAIYKCKGRLVKSGLYSRIRHPQYLGFILIIIAFNIQWPTIITLIMGPVLIYMYYRLAKKEERILIHKFGAEYIDYMKSVPGFYIKLKK